ncbi:MAG: DUF779 domain-containing protein [Actinobacteria bacterium]|nr:DUF779 domain-containing protein [Actinomycetota bacterium]
MPDHLPGRGAPDRGPWSRQGRTGLSVGTVIATPAAVDAILRLRARHHAIAFRQSADRQASDRPSPLTETELPPGINDLQLGEIGGVPFLVDADQYKRWGCPDLVVDVIEGDEEPPLRGGDGGLRLALRASH